MTITAEQVLTALDEHTNVLLYGPPGTGKSHLMKEVENLFLSRCGEGVGRPCVDTERERNAIVQGATTEGHSRWVTFHQGYTYEDFIVGLRPATGQTNGGGGLALEARAGALLELAAYARTSAGLLLIDEINRGNASRIFGEFITLMEAGKRLAIDGKKRPETVTVTLPYLPKDASINIAKDVSIEREFAMPQRVYTLASMNSVDKSVAPLDAAIRRRFYVINLRPTLTDLEDAAAAGSGSPVARCAASLVAYLNRNISLFLGPEYALGQYYLPHSPKLGELHEEAAKQKLCELWLFRLLPQVLELFQGRPDVCKLILKLDKELGNCGVDVVEPTDEELDEGATTCISMASAMPTPDELYVYLSQLSATGTAQ